MQKFYEYLLAGDLHHETSERNKRLNNSLCSDGCDEWQVFK